MYVPIHVALLNNYSQNVHKLLLATSPLGRGGSMQYFGKEQGFAEPWLIMSTKTRGVDVHELRRDSPKWRSDSNFMLHNRSNLTNPTGPLQ